MSFLAAEHGRQAGTACCPLEHQAGEKSTHSRAFRGAGAGAAPPLPCVSIKLPGRVLKAESILTIQRILFSGQELCPLVPWPPENKFSIQTQGFSKHLPLQGLPLVKLGKLVMDEQELPGCPRNSLSRVWWPRSCEAQRELAELHL